MYLTATPSRAATQMLTSPTDKLRLDRETRVSMLWVRTSLEASNASRAI